MEEILLRPATDDDFPFLLLVHRLTMKSYVEATWGRWDDADQEERLRGEFEPAKCEIIVFDNKAVGYVSVEDHEDFFFIAFIAILPEYQRLGIGTKIIQNVITRGNERKIPVCLNVLKVNPARSLYERLGFRVVGGDEHRLYMIRLPDPTSRVLYNGHVPKSS